MGEVIDIAEYRKKKVSTIAKDLLSFEEIMKQNQLNEERVARERARYNKRTMREHRLGKK